MKDICGEYISTAPGRYDAIIGREELRDGELKRSVSFIEHGKREERWFISPAVAVWVSKQLEENLMVKRGTIVAFKWVKKHTL